MTGLRDDCILDSRGSLQPEGDLEIGWSVSIGEAGVLVVVENNGNVEGIARIRVEHIGITPDISEYEVEKVEPLLLR